MAHLTNPDELRKLQLLRAEYQVAVAMSPGTEDKFHIYKLLQELDVAIGRLSLLSDISRGTESSE